MAAVLWLLQHVSDVPVGDHWLSPTEQAVLTGLRFPKRRRDWRLGRWTAKRALSRAGVAGVEETDPASWTRVSIRALDGGAPCAFLVPDGVLADGPPGDERATAATTAVSDVPCGWVVSLSHTGEYGLCALAARPAVIGCDVESIGRRGEEFVVEWFTDAERDLVSRAPEGDDRSRIVTLVWSAKEAALKALGIGLRIDTRDVKVELADVRPAAQGDAPTASPSWQPLRVRMPDRLFTGWWQSGDERVMTIVADPTPDVPVAL